MNNSRWAPVLSRVCLLLAVSLFPRGAAAGGARAPKLTPQVSGTTFRLQAVSPVSEKVVWASERTSFPARMRSSSATCRA